MMHHHHVDIAKVPKAAFLRTVEKRLHQSFRAEAIKKTIEKEKLKKTSSVFVNSFFGFFLN
jgi:hypothetical protein